MTNLSPAALTVIAAYNRETRPEPHHQCEAIAAALRAAVDQMAPFPSRYPMNEYMEGLRDAGQNARRELLAIAAELEALDD